MEAIAIVYNSKELFKLDELVAGIAGARALVYVAGGAIPASSLDQSSRSDYELTFADNISRACRELGIEQIYCLDVEKTLDGKTLTALKSRGASLALFSRKRELELELGQDLGAKLDAPTEGPSARQRDMLVRSVQRSPIAGDATAQGAAKEYMAWLPRAMGGLLRVKRSDGRISFCLLGILPILVMEDCPEQNDEDLQVYAVSGGLLALRNKRARLEFRLAPDRSWLLCAIHDFSPALPWWFYRCTQALVHLAVMTLFGRHLRLIAEGKRKWIHQS